MSAVRCQASITDTTAARVAFAGAAAALCLSLGPCVAPAEAAGRKAPPVTESAGRCEVSALDKFADTRATFSQEASGGNMVEALVDIRGKQLLDGRG